MLRVSLAALAAILFLFAAADAARFSPSVPQWGGCGPGRDQQECATIMVPMDWTSTAAGDNRNVTIAVSRYHPMGTTPNRTIWFLGEGCTLQTGALTGWVNYLASREPQGFYVAVPDMRGTGLSTPHFTCLDDIGGDKMPTVDCANTIKSNFSDQVKFYGLTQSAYDLNYTISMLGTANNYVMADSFGSLWAQRLNALNPRLVKKMLMSGFTAPDRYDFFSSFVNFDSVTTRILDHCQSNPVCAARTGGGRSLVSLLRTIMEAADNNILPCIKSLPAKMAEDVKGDWKEALGGIIARLAGPMDMFARPHRNIAEYIPAFIYRLLRCNADDVSKISKLYDVLNANEPKIQARDTTCRVSQALRYTIIFNEYIQQKPRPIADMLNELGFLTIQPTSVQLTLARALYEAWPKYDVDELARKYAGGTPMLLLAGDLDTSTSFEMAQFSMIKYDNVNTTFRRLTQIPHQALYMPMKGSDVSCVVQMATGYFAFQQTIPTCENDFVPLDFLGQSPSQDRVNYWGQDDMWSFTAPNVDPVPTLSPNHTVPVPTFTSKPPPTTTAAPGGDSGGSKTGVILGLLFGIPIGLVILYYGYKWFKGRGGSEDKRYQFMAVQ